MKGIVLYCTIFTDFYVLFKIVTMKLLYIFFFFLSFTTVFAQQNAILNRIITVTGSAEMNVKPDEIELEIIISNAHLKSNDKESRKKAEDDFFDVLKKNGISIKEVKLSSSSYYWLYWWRYNRGDYHRKTYRVKLDVTTDFMSLMKDLDYKEVESIRILDRTNKRIQEYRKDVKIKAVKAAKDKATYLLESIDEKLGSIVTLEELTPNNNNYYWRGQQNALSNVVVSNSSNDTSMQNVSTIKIRYEVKAVFYIQ